MLKTDGKLYVVRNVCKSYDALTSAKQLAEKIKWPVRVERISTKARYYKDITVCAQQPPPTWHPCMYDLMTGDYQPVAITELGNGYGDPKGIQRVIKIKSIFELT